MNDSLFGTREDWRRWREWIAPLLVMLSEGALLVTAIILLA